MTDTLPYPTDPSIATATFKANPDDFIVTEILNLELTQQGEHLWLYVKKTGLNTAFVAKLLCQWANISEHDVGYSGLKDRHATTYQWFSLRIPKSITPDVSFDEFAKTKLSDGEHISTLKQAWHSKKLSRGTHKHNHFCIRLTHCQADKAAVQAQLSHIAKHGIPNYFGHQRFGIDGANLDKAEHFFGKILADNRPYRPRKKDAIKHSLYISTARSHLFNQILAKRVQNGTWCQPMTGDVFNLNGTGSVFVSDIDDTIIARLLSGDIHPTGWLYGQDNACRDDAQALEMDVIAKPDNAVFVQGLNAISSKSARRALRLMVDELSWRWQDDTLVLDFLLPKGSFATELLANLVADLTDGHGRQAVQNPTSQP